MCMSPGFRRSREGSSLLWWRSTPPRNSARSRGCVQRRIEKATRPRHRGAIDRIRSSRWSYRLVRVRRSPRRSRGPTSAYRGEHGRTRVGGVPPGTRALIADDAVGEDMESGCVGRHDDRVPVGGEGGLRFACSSRLARGHCGSLLGCDVLPALPDITYSLSTFSHHRHKLVCVDDDGRALAEFGLRTRSTHSVAGL